VCGDLIVESGGRVELRGMVCGNVRSSGDLTVDGTIEGRLDMLDGASTSVSEGARIAGKTQAAWSRKPDSSA
ncbi:hypothetical protein LMQ05_13350, partial [Staphylococcus aureus]|uniref:hypothetical protein n=1 Tax=Staphylococcus aureus TaxID=1280 RepID=UPI001E58BF7A